MISRTTFTYSTPSIVSVVAGDFDNGDDVYGVGDTITVRFDKSTDLAANGGAKAFVDRLLRFDPPIGTGV